MATKVTITISSQSLEYLELLLRYNQRKASLSDVRTMCLLWGFRIGDKDPVEPYIEELARQVHIDIHN